MLLFYEMGKFFHVYNRGVDKRQVFMDRLDTWRFKQALLLFNTTRKIEIFDLSRADLSDSWKERTIRSGERLVEIHAYSLCLNHFHLLLEEKQENGASNFMKKVSAGYTRYFNYRYNRSGSLFSGRFKRRIIDSDADLKNIAAYVHGNLIVHDIGFDHNLAFSSYHELFLLGENHLEIDVIVDKQKNKNLFGNLQEFKRYIKTTVQRTKDRREELTEDEVKLFIEKD